MKESCLCGSKQPYLNCCSIYHTKSELPSTAEQLMRSRYTAYALKLVDYLVETTHPDKLKSSYRRKLVATINDIQWTKLEIVKTSAGGMNDKAGKVKFEASYVEQGEEGVLEEHSRFRKIADHWYYYDGKG